MDVENSAPQSASVSKPNLPEWQKATSYILISLAILIIPLALFWPAFIRLEKNPAGFDEPPVLGVESFWQFSLVASILMLVVALGALVLLLKRRPRKIIYVAIASTLIYGGSIYLHEQAKQAKINKLYERPTNNNAESPTSNPVTDRKLRKAVEDFVEAFNKLERTYIESEIYGRAWKVMLAVTLSFWVGWLLQFSKNEYKRAWNWALSKAPIFEQRFKQCQSCGGSNFLEASRCKHCGNPFIKP